MFKKTAVLVGLMGVLTGCGGSSGSGKSVAIGLVEAPPPAVATLPYYYVPQFSGLGDNARIRVTGLPQWASLDPVTGAISGIPGEEDVTAGVELSLTATDGALQGEATVALKVEHGAAYRQREALDFYAVDGEGKPRALRNDLSGGTLQGEVQFVQSHSVRPRHNVNGAVDGSGTDRLGGRSGCDRRDPPLWKQSAVHGLGRREVHLHCPGRGR